MQGTFSLSMLFFKKIFWGWGGEGGGAVVIFFNLTLMLHHFIYLYRPKIAVDHKGQKV